MTVQMLEVHVGYVQPFINVFQTRGNIYVMPPGGPQKNDPIPSPRVSTTRGISQNFFQDYVCCICGHDAALTHGQSESLFCLEHHPEMAGATIKRINDINTIN